jgi:Na+-translocating ferredoxin:NAD+ oxidoreductase RnfD subunit
VTPARQFFRTPKGLLTAVLAALAGLAAPSEGMAVVAPGLAAGTAAAMLVDAPLLRWRKGSWEFPTGALLTGLIIAMVLSPQEPWYVTASTSVIAVIGKYAVRTRSANVFNPAAIGIVATFYLFDTGQSWWGALPDGSLWLLAALSAAGVFIADRVNKMPLVLAFLGTYYLLFTATAFAADPRHVAEIFRPPDLNAALFMAFFILTDPPTSPVKYHGQIVCGAIVAAASYAVFEVIGAAYYLLAGVLVGNLWEAGSRMRAGRRRQGRRS